MKLSASFSQTKALAYSSFILLVLGAFLLGYFYYYLPTNKQTVQKDGFLTLRTIADNITDKNTDRQNLYKNVISEARQQEPGKRQAYVDTLLSQNNVDASARYIRNAVNQPGVEAGEEPTPAQLSIRGENFVYLARAGQDKVVVTESIANFLEPILLTQKAELFDSYALACVDSTGSKLLYHDANLGIRSDVRLDTLLARNVQGYLTGVRDIQSPEFNHKLFYYPFKVSSVQFVLCGFAREDLYQQNVRKVPFYFVYPLAITFLLLLVFMPGLKFYIMDADEQVRVSDVVLFGLSMIVGASLCTLIVVQFLLWQGEEGSARQHLKMLSEQIERNFVQELKEAYTCVDALDEFRKSQLWLTQPGGAKKNVDVSADVRAFMRTSLRRSAHIYLFDRVSWVDNREGRNFGKQVIKAEMVGKPLFTNVKGRNYFKVFQNNDAFALPDGSDTTRLFGWEPIYSQTNADFNITLSKPTGTYIVALASKMYSVVNAVLPVGYGFCIIDGEGKVLLHTNVNRNLRENLFEKVEPATELRGLVAARQETDINEVMLYGSGHMLHVRPIPNLPYSLVTFYDKAFLISVNMRILIFAFLFSTLSGLTCALLWLILGRTNFRSYPLLYGPMDCLTWLIPQKRQSAYYVHGLLFLIIYLLGLLLVNRLSYSGSSHFTQLSTVLLTPINVVCCLHVIGATFRYVNRPTTDPLSATGRRRLIIVSGVHLTLSVAFFAIARYIGYPIGWLFLLFQGGVNGWMWTYVGLSRNYLRTVNQWERGYPTTYTLMLTALVINLAVLPSALYSWYGYRQEQVQVVKKRQLHLAGAIRDRSRLLMNTTGLANPEWLPFIENRLIQQGVYTVDGDSTALVNSVVRNTAASTFERFYFTIAESLSNRYHDPKLYPALADSSADRRWQWALANGRVHLWYRNPLPDRAIANANSCYLHIASALPGSYLFSDGNRPWVLGSLCLLVALLLWGLYSWLRVTTENIFLMKFINAYAVDGPKDRKTYAWAIDDVYADSWQRDKLNVLDKEASRVVRGGETTYKEQWEAIPNEKEKYLLYDFAYDGLLNYKNTNEIHRLIDKGILVVAGERLAFADPGFRAFLLNIPYEKELKQMHEKYQQHSTWQSLKGPLLLLLIGFASFIFFTQEAAFNKILAVGTGVTTLLSLLPKLLGKQQPTTGAS